MQLKMSLYEGLEVETAPIPEISIQSSADPSSTSNSNDVSENKNISKSEATSLPNVYARYLG